MSDAQLVRVCCCHCRSDIAVDGITSANQLRICPRCNNTFWLGAIYLCAPSEEAVRRTQNLIYNKMRQE